MLRVVRSSASSASRFFTISPFVRPSSPRFSSIPDSAPFQKVKIPRKWGDHSILNGYLVGEDDAPGIVVLQDWLGVDHHVKNHALRISQLGRGFKVLIPDLYKGNREQLFKGYDWEGAVLDVYSSVEWLKNNGLKKVGVTGFCRGGALAITSSYFFTPVDAVVAFYGTPCSLLSNSDCPVQAHFGELDDFVRYSDVEAAKELHQKLKASQVPHEVHIYSGKRHSFMNRSVEGIERQNSMEVPDEHDAAVQLAWSRFETWMTNYLYS